MVIYFPFCLPRSEILLEKVFVNVVAFENGRLETVGTIIASLMAGGDEDGR